jgi:hypothetical protein
MATEDLRAIADPRSANSGREVRCSLCWRPGSPMAPSRTLSDPALGSATLPWQEVYHDAELHDLARVGPTTPKHFGATHPTCPMLWPRTRGG